MRLNITVDDSGLKAMFREFDTKTKELKGSAKFAIDRFVIYAKANCPVESGKLQRSIGNPGAGGTYTVSPDGLSASAGTELIYAAAVEYGVQRQYPIVPKTKTLLKFQYEGKTRYAKQVIHPTTKGKNFMTKAATQAEQETIARFGR